MKQSEKFVGKIMTHPSLGKVSVDSICDNSRVMVNVTVVDRGEGYNEFKDNYTGVKTSTGWHRGENREFGHKDIAHIKDLTLWDN